MTIQEFTEKVVLLAILHKFSVSSWIRSRSRNEQVGGHPQSKHLVGLAIDVIPDKEEEKNEIISDAVKLGLKALDEGDHIHLQAP